MSDDTVLVLSGIGIPDFSARGLTQTASPIDAAANARRTINGRLHNLSFDQFQKFKSTISCSDQAPPALDGIFPGHLLTVECMFSLTYPNGGSPNRPVIPGSERVQGGFTLYRPQLEMMLMSFSMATDEWAAGVQWQLDLEEI